MPGKDYGGRDQARTKSLSRLGIIAGTVVLILGVAVGVAVLISANRSENLNDSASNGQVTAVEKPVALFERRNSQSGSLETTVKQIDVAGPAADAPKQELRSGSPKETVTASGPSALTDQHVAKLERRIAELEAARKVDGAAKTDNMPLTDIIPLVERAVVRLDSERSDGSVAVGSGFLVDANGRIVTNCHVVVEARKLRATFHDGTVSNVEGLLSVDPSRDIALVRLSRVPSTVVPLKLSSLPTKKGEQVTAVGAPLGLSFSASDGIVSSIRAGSEINQLFTAFGANTSYAGSWIQTTAPISHGNSGGPLVNGKGEVVGMNTLRDPRGDNLGFAISAADIRQILDESGNASPTAFAELPKAIGEHKLLLPVPDERKLGTAVVVIGRDGRLVERGFSEQLMALVRSVLEGRGFELEPDVTKAAWVIGVQVTGDPTTDRLRAACVGMVVLAKKSVDDKKKIDIRVVRSRPFSFVSERDGPPVEVTVTTFVRNSVSEFAKLLPSGLKRDHLGSESRRAENKTAEEKAQMELDLAKKLASSNPKATNSRLKAILRKYPDTAAAKEAQSLITED
jgi:S1-C subfamily serine protease